MGWTAHFQPLSKGLRVKNKKNVILKARHEYKYIRAKLYFAIKKENRNGLLKQCERNRINEQQLYLIDKKREVHNINEMNI